MSKYIRTIYVVFLMISASTTQAQDSSWPDWFKLGFDESAFIVEMSSDNEHENLVVVESGGIEFTSSRWISKTKYIKQFRIPPGIYYFKAGSDSDVYRIDAAPNKFTYISLKVEENERTFLKPLFIYSNFDYSDIFEINQLETLRRYKNERIDIESINPLKQEFTLNIRPIGGLPGGNEKRPDRSDDQQTNE